MTLLNTKLECCGHSAKRHIGDLCIVGGCKCGKPRGITKYAKKEKKPGTYGRDKEYAESKHED